MSLINIKTLLSSEASAPNMPMKRVWIGVGVAAVLWFVMFSEWIPFEVPFWTTMCIAGTILTTLSFCFCKELRSDFHFDWKEVAIGIGMAIIFWCVFWVADKIAAWMFDFARPQVDGIYGLKDGENPWVIGAMLLFLIGPAEEIFWRGFVERRMIQRHGALKGFIFATLIYAGIHIWSFNFMLFMAALVIGALWGAFYMLFPKHLTALVISHSVWDFMAFVLFPI